jgi:hypothetical protein
MLFCIGVQLGLFSQANRTLPGVREQDGEEKIWALKTGTNKQTTKITGLQTGDKFQKAFTPHQSCSRKSNKMQGAGHVTSMAR